ncbi:hypothetical protein ISS03_00475 [Patescibacteria group bacterium]|nr:hypothetical protein [Patescibacteria group bacterium]
MPELKEKKLITVDFEKAFGEKLSSYVEEKIKQYDFTYTDFTQEERDYWLRRAVDILLDPNLEFSGEHRRDQWEVGWGQNLSLLEKEDVMQSINPHYFGKYPILRFCQKFIKPISSNFEVNSLYVIQHWLFDQYLRDSDSIYEFGCGTGHNLFNVQEINTTAKIWGLDWANCSQDIIRKLVADGMAKNFYAHNFDYFKPDENFKLGTNSAIYTVASLEQIGTDFKPFVEYILKNKPNICIHIEPFNELLDEKNLLDYLSLRYFKKRRYVNGFIDHLHELEANGKIKIIREQRSFIGSFFIDGYTVVVWSPII